MTIGTGRGDPPPWRALHIALLDQIRLDDVFDRVAFLADRGGQVIQADRPAIKALDDEFEQAPVHLIEARGIDIEHGQGGLGDGLIDSTDHP